MPVQLHNIELGGMGKKLSFVLLRKLVVSALTIADYAFVNQF